MGIKYKIKKWIVRIKRDKSKDLGLNDIQQKAYDIVIRLINDKESELLIDPETGRKGIRKKDVFVKIHNNRISIINGIYYYDIGIEDIIRENIIDKFNSKLSRKFNAIDNQVTSKIKNSLDNIKLNID
jgi:hypothetical protein